MAFVLKRKGFKDLLPCQKKFLDSFEHRRKEKDVAREALN